MLVNRLSTFLALGLLLYALPSRGQQATSMTLPQAIAYANTNSLDIRNAQISLADAGHRIAELRSSGLPQISASANYQRFLQVPVMVLPEAFVLLFETLGVPASREATFQLKNNFGAAINVESLIFDGSYITALKAASAYRDYVAKEVVMTQREVRNRVMDAYLPALFIQENIDLLDKNIANLESLYRETRELYKAGFAEQLDVDRLELSLVNLGVERENLQRQRAISIAALKYAINYPADQPLDVAEDIDGLLNDGLEAELLSDNLAPVRPEIDVIDMGIRLNELNIRVNKAGYLPTLSAFGTYQQNYQSNTREDGFWAPTAVVGVRLNVPIFDGMYKNAKIQRAKLDLETVRNQREDLARGIRLEVSTGRDSYLAARQRVTSQERNVKLAERIYETTKIKYKEGIGSSLEVTQAEQSLYTTQSNYIQALYDLLQAKMALTKALGR